MAKILIEISGYDTEGLDFKLRVEADNENDFLVYLSKHLKTAVPQAAYAAAKNFIQEQLQTVNKPTTH